ncbi:MAG: zf-HC2 domain-containing protein [Myxococcota bacterium]
MSCELVRRHVGALVDGELDPTSQIELERHVDACAPCQELVEFEVATRQLVHEALAAPAAPAHLSERVRFALDRAPTPGVAPREPWVRAWPVAPRHAVPAAAAMSLIVLGGLKLGVAEDGPAVNAASMLEDVVELHSAGLPADVQVPEPPAASSVPRVAGPPAPARQRVVQYFRDKVTFPVRPAVFDDARLVGARLSNVRERRAAALYYDVDGRRMTVVVTDAPVGEAQEAPEGSAGLGAGSLQYQDVRGYPVPVRREAGLTYAFTGDLAREELLRLAASARVSP